MQDPDYIKKSLKEYQKGEITLILVAIVILGGLLLTGGLANFALNQNTDSPSYLNTQNSAPSNLIPVYSPIKSGSKNALQMGTISFITPTPTPPTVTTAPEVTPSPSNGSVCLTDGPKTPDCTCATLPYYEDLYYYCTFPSNSSTDNKANALSCQSGGGMYTELTGSKLTYWNHSGNFVCAYTAQSTNYAAHQNDPNCYAYCVGKPVIYLYPTVPTWATVKLSIPGIITTSIPTYSQTGWQHILAQPSGVLTYQGKKYHELFYESEVNKVNAPQDGLIIASSQLKQKLLLYTHQLGLLPSEQQEFLQYWMPKLQALHAPYVDFSVLSQTEKERIDHVTISPKPDTMIEFLVYFKPLWKKEDIEPLKLPSAPPKRIGFTAVEWGGMIDTQSIK